MSTTKLVPLLAVGLLLAAGCQDQVPPLAPDDAALAVAEDAPAGPQVQPPRVGDYTIEMFDVEFPGETIGHTRAIGINGQGDVVGTYTIWDGDGEQWLWRSYMLSNGKLHRVHFPGSLQTGARAINDRGEIVGSWWEGEVGTGTRGFMLRDGEYTRVEVPGAAQTYLFGLNSSGVATGQWLDGGGFWHGFFLKDGVFTTFDVPGATHTTPMGINPQGDIVGYYVDPTRDPARKTRYWPFLRLADGTFFTDHEYPVGPIRMMALQSINPRGDLVGWYRPVTPWSPYFGFVLDKQGTYTKLEIPDAWETEPLGINASGVVVGSVYFWIPGDPSKPFNLFNTTIRGWIAFPARGAGK
jgi:uncharacterized membrane protein